jgi:hypothetical protein
MQTLREPGVDIEAQGAKPADGSLVERDGVLGGAGLGSFAEIALN